MAATLFELGSADEQPQRPAKASAGGTPRLRTPERRQVEMQWLALDELLEPEHPVRVVWQAVMALDLSRWLQTIEAVEGTPGRDATDPRLLLALWVYATVDGVGSARRLAKLCDPKFGPLAYRWLCGGVTLNYHTLSSFRSQNADAWDELITQVVAVLMHAELVSLNRVAQDGMRVRANAGKSSFRRRATLEECLRDAREQVETLAQLSEEDPQELTTREQAARERAAREREELVRKALENCEELQKKRDERSKVSGEKAKEARASTTDPESRNMKFPNGGYDPGYNVQYCTDTASGIIVGVDVTNAGSDAEQFLPMLDQLQERYNQTPAEGLADGGFTTKEMIAAAAERGCTVYAPVKEEEKQRAKGKNPFEKKRGDKPPVAAWRERMGTAAAQAIYKLRAQTAEWVNAMARNRGFYRMPVRGQVKCRITATLYAIAHNIVHGANLRAEAAMR
jgi:transposase